MVILFLLCFFAFFLCLSDWESVSYAFRIVMHSHWLPRTDYLKRLRRRALGGNFACYAILIDCLIASSGENNSSHLSIYPARHNPRHFTILICHIRGNLTPYSPIVWHTVLCDGNFMCVGSSTTVQHFNSANILCINFRD